MKRFLIVASLILSFNLGLAVGFRQPVVVTKAVIREVPVEVVKVVEKPIIITQNVTEYVELRDFASLDELYAWLDSVSWDDVLNRPLPPAFDCDDLAQILQKKAEQDGYRMNIEVCVLFGKLHMRNLVIIGNCVYEIEPVSHIVSFYVYLDEPE